LLVFLLLKLNPMGIFDSDTKLSASTLHGIDDGVSKLVVAFGVTEDPLISIKIDRLLDGESSESLLVAVDHLVRADNLGRSENFSLHFLRSHVQLETPLSHAFLIKELFAHALDSFNLFIRSDSGLGESITHSSTFTNIVRDSIDKAKLRREEEGVITSLDLEERLFGLADFHLVLGVKVISDRSFFSLILEGHGHRRHFEDNITDDVCPLVAPVGDDGMTTVLKFDHLFPVVLVLSVPLQLVDLLEA